VLFQSSILVSTEAVRSKLSSFCDRNQYIHVTHLIRGPSEAAIIRNAGGRASDSLRSIATLDAIGGLSTIIVVHHTGECGAAINDCLDIYCRQPADAPTDCGTTLVRDEEVREMLRKRAPEKSEEIAKMTFGEITE
jgi:carbonic anhydrase